MSHTPSRKLRCEALNNSPHQSSKQQILNPLNRCTTSGALHVGRILCWVHRQRYNEGKPLHLVNEGTGLRLLFPAKELELR